MAIPNRVREEAAAADAEMRRLAAEQAAPPAPQVVPAGSPTHPSPSDPPAEPHSLDGVPPGDTPHPNSVPDNREPGEPISAEAYAELLQKYETLQGLHNKDRQKLAQTETRLETIERVLQAQMAAREAAPAEPAPAPAAPARREPPKLLKPEEVEEFGADLIDVVRRAAREEYMPALDDVLDQLQRLQTKVAQISQVAGNTAELATNVAEERFNSQLDKLVQGADGTPDWREIDSSQDYIDWLQKVGDDSDEPRLHVLQRAYQRKDAQKCAGFLNSYKREKGLPMGTNAPGTPPAPPAPNPVDAAAALISPSPVAPAAPTNNRGAKKTYTLGEIERTYSDFTKGKFKGREAEYRALTAEYDKATLEGRVTSK